MLSLLSLALDSRRLDRRLDKDVMTSARHADVSLLARPTHARTATVEISWETRPRAACLELGCRDTATWQHLMSFSSSHMNYCCSRARTDRYTTSYSMPQCNRFQTKSRGSYSEKNGFGFYILWRPIGSCSNEHLLAKNVDITFKRKYSTTQQITNEF